MFENWHPVLQQLADVGIKTSPGWAITATTFIGVTWEQWVYILTAVFTFAQLSYFLYKRGKEINDGCKHRRNGSESRKARKAARQDDGPDDQEAGGD